MYAAGQNLLLLEIITDRLLPPVTSANTAAALSRHLKPKNSKGTRTGNSIYGTLTAHIAHLTPYSDKVEISIIA